MLVWDSRVLGAMQWRRLPGGFPRMEEFVKRDTNEVTDEVNVRVPLDTVLTAPGHQAFKKRGDGATEQA